MNQRVLAGASTCVRRVVGAIALSCFLLLAACGGGDKGSASSDPTVVLTSPSSINAEVFQGGSVPTINLVGRMTGDLSRLVGNAIYIAIENPAGLFGPTPLVSSFPTTDHSMEITLAGLTQTTVGRKSGTMRVLVCQDAGCTRQYAGSPLRIPYDVNVLPGLSVATETLLVETGFGDTSPTRSVNVGLPADLVSWQVEPDGHGEMAYLAKLSTRRMPDGSGVADLTLPGAAPGSYQLLFKVDATAPLPNGNTMAMSAPIRVLYTVRPNDAVSHMFEPAALRATLSSTDIYSRDFTPPRVILNAGATVTLRGVEHLSHPAAANGNFVADSWLQTYYVTRCMERFDSSTGLSTRACLPAGRYEARLVYDVRFNGTTSTAYVPFSLDIGP